MASRCLLEKEMATHSSVLAWRIPWTEKPGGLQSMGLHRVRNDWSDLAAAAVDVFIMTLVPKLTKGKGLLCLNEKYGHNILQLFSPTAWIRGGFVVYFDQQNVAGVKLCKFWSLDFKMPFSFLLHLFGTSLQPWREIWARLTKDERPHGEAQPVTSTEAPDTWVCTP